MTGDARLHMRRVSHTILWQGYSGHHGATQAVCKACDTPHSRAWQLSLQLPGLPRMHMPEAPRRHHASRSQLLYTLYVMQSQHYELA